MITVETYMRVSGEYVPIGSFTGPVEDPLYVEGAIEMVVDWVPLFTLELWDYVDQLWEYLIDLFVEVSEGREASVFFPDQPIQVSAKPIRERALADFKIDLGDAVRHTHLELQRFLPVFCDAGEAFFRKLIELDESNFGDDARLFVKLDALRQFARIR